MFYLLKLCLNFSINCISPLGCTASGQFVLFSFENFIKMIKHLWFLIFGHLSQNGLGQMVISPVDLSKIEPDAIVPELQLNQGVVTGKRYSDLGVEVFTGIPYAQAGFYLAVILSNKISLSGIRLPDGDLVRIPHLAV